MLTACRICVSVNFIDNLHLNNSNSFNIDCMCLHTIAKITGKHTII